MTSTSPARKGSGWAWFWGGTTLALAVALGSILWLISASGLAVPLALYTRGSFTGVATSAPPRLSDEDSPNPPSEAPPAAFVPGAPRDTEPAPARLAPRPPTPTTASGDIAARRGEIIAARQWRLMVNDTRSESLADGGRRVFVDLTVKNDGDRAATLIVPATIDPPPRSSRATWNPDLTSNWQPIQSSDPPTLSLYLVDAADRQYGGGFVGADGDPTGGYNFISAPGDAIRLTYAFALPTRTAEPFGLMALFGADAGGVRARIRLDETASPADVLAPSDRSRVNGKESRLEVGKIWSFTALGITVGQPDRSGQRVVTTRISAENLTDRPLPVGATLDDPTGTNRDFYVVDSVGRLAYSSADSMPRNIIPPRATRTVDLRLQAPREFSANGLFRLSIVVEPRNDLYAVFRFS
ncbi:MAG: hypothetical protein EPO26_05050 [Chloroflexota bacterium]|nr:MAG: hypothetical protein EPO26_05050 [Chloroflexota bacterium]